MYFIGIFGQSVFYSQFFSIMQSKSAENVSLFGFLCGLISVTSWMIYGIAIRDKPLAIANIVATIGAILAVCAILMYR